MTSPISLICSCSIHLFAATPRHISLEAIESKCSTWHLGSCAIWVEYQGVKMKSSKNVDRVLENTSIHIVICMSISVCTTRQNISDICIYQWIYMFNTNTYVCMHIIYIYVYIYDVYISIYWFIVTIYDVYMCFNLFWYAFKNWNVILCFGLWW